MNAAADTINRCRTHLDPFRESFLPPEAFSYERYMDLYKLTKSEAKRVVQRFKAEKVYLNDTYQVNVQADESDFIHLSIKRRDKEPIHDWRDLQAIKNMLVGPEHEGIELFPAESRLVDTANQYHLWVLKKTGMRIPVGWLERLVLEPGTHADESVQRPFADAHIQSPDPEQQQENPAP